MLKLTRNVKSISSEPQTARNVSRMYRSNTVKSMNTYNLKIEAQKIKLMTNALQSLKRILNIFTTIKRTSNF